MQKKIIALAIASAMTVPALAYAEANISGQANMSIDVINNGTTADSQSVNQLNSNQSRLVIKGSDDLGDGLSAMYQLDTRFTMDNGAAGSTFWGGNNFVGLKSNSIGSVMAGRIDAPYKTAFRKLDLFYDVAGDNRVGVGAIGGLFETDVRLNNALAYVSPSWSGVQLSVATVFGGEGFVSQTAKQTGNDKKGSAYSLAATYSMDAIYAAFGYQTAKIGDAGTGDLGASATTGAKDDQSDTWKLGGGWTMDAFTLNAEVEGTTYKSVGFTDNTGMNFYLGAKFAISGADSVRFAYTSHGETEGGGVVKAKNNDGATQYAIGYDHSMSKATSVYVSYVKTSANDGYNAGTTAYTAGADPSAISLGVKHAF